MKTYHRSRLNAFLSLDWYEVALRFLFSFIAKTSEILLAAGLVVSTTNFLTDGSLLATHPDVSVAWAWAQALAIDSSLGVSLASTFQYLKQGAWIKGVLYGLLTLLLALVAGAITTIDIVSHALHITTSNAMLQMNINITILSRLRAVAVIGFMLMARIRDLPLKELLVREEAPAQSSAPSVGTPLPKTSTQAVAQSLLSQFSAQEVAQIVNDCVASGKVALAHPQSGVPVPPQSQSNQHDPQEHGSQQNGAVPYEKPLAPTLDPRASTPAESSAQVRQVGTVPGALIESVPVPSGASAPGPIHSQGKPTLKSAITGNLAVPEKERSLALQSGAEQQNGSLEKRRPVPVPQEESSLERDQQLEQAYQLLLAEGKKPSGRALAERVHIHRATCVAWLREKQRQDAIEPLTQKHEGSKEPVPEISDSASTLEAPMLADDLQTAVDDASPGVSPASPLPEDTPPL